MLAGMEIDPRDLAGLERAMLRIQAVKNVPLSKVVRNAARDFVQEAYRATPLAKVRQTDFLKLHKRVPPAHDNRARWVRKYPTRSGGKWSPPFSVARGFSKSSWIGMMQQLGMRGRAGMDGAAKYGDVLQGQADAKLFIELVNSLPWIARLDKSKDIRARGIRHATSRIERELARLGQSLAEDWSR